MESFNLKLDELLQFPKEGIFSKVILKEENYQYTVMCLAKGSDIDTHTSTRNGCVQVLQGKGSFNLDGNDIPLEPGVFIYMPANAPHSLKADADLAILLSLFS